jgi:hypothetical protein
MRDFTWRITSLELCYFARHFWMASPEDDCYECLPHPPPFPGVFPSILINLTNGIDLMGIAADGERVLWRGMKYGRSGWWRRPVDNLFNTRQWERLKQEVQQRLTA